MAGQTQTVDSGQQPHGGIGFAVFAYSLSEAICREGIPSLDIGLAAAKQGLVKMTVGEGTPHFEWDKARLDKLTVKTLEALLVNLRRIQR